jgi:HSP20 family molecular chaperone IbpA
MKGQSAVQRRKAVKAVKLVPAQDLVNRQKEIHDMVARRAFALFEDRGGIRGHDINDWTEAEAELLHACRHDLKESVETLIFHADLPGPFEPDQISVSVEPHRLMVSGERELNVRFEGDEPSTVMRTQRIFLMEELPVDVDPSRTTARLEGEMLEIVMPKVASGRSG